MAKLYLKLENEDGSFNEFRKDKVKARWIKEGLKHSKKISEFERKGDEIAVFEERVKFICEVFEDKELTPDRILDGMECDQLIPELDRIFNIILGNTEPEGERGK